MVPGSPSSVSEPSSGPLVCGRSWSVRRAAHPRKVCEQQMAPIRVVVAKPGLDGHDRGAKVVARALRDAGMEVIYTGLHQTPEQIVETAIAGGRRRDRPVGALRRAHDAVPKVLDLLGSATPSDILVFGGGIIPEADIPPLEEPAWPRSSRPAPPRPRIVDWVRGHVGDASAARRRPSPA